MLVDTMAKDGIPIQTGGALVDKLHTMIAETQAVAEATRIKEERHAKNNAAYIKDLQEQITALKAKALGANASLIPDKIKENMS